MIYEEYSPSVPLRPYVRCYWRLHGLGGQRIATERVVPDGCPEIVLNRAERFRRIDAGGLSRPQADILLVGQISRAIHIVPGQAVDVFGIRFEPGGLRPLLGVPMHELTDVDLCLGQASRRLRHWLSEALAFASTPAYIEAVESALVRMLAGRRPAPPGNAGLVGQAVRLIEHGIPTMAALSAALDVNPRRLERAFRREVGMSPKLFQRIRRVQAVLRQLHRHSAASWATLAAHGGFADQSHLIRDFRLIVGTTPRQFVREQTTLTDLFSARPVSRSSNTRVD